MSRHIGLPKSGGGDPVTNSNPDVDAVPAAPPAKFGRLALWMASASALTVGVVGAVAYGIWFNDDQRVYAAAMVSARQALRVTGPASPMQPTPSSVQVVLSSPAPAQPTTVSDADPVVPPASSARFDLPATPSPDGTAPRLAAGQPDRLKCSAMQDRRHPPSRVRSNGDLYTGMSSSSHRVSYRRHDNGSQRDLYSHP